MAIGVPQNPQEGDLYWDSPTGTMRVWDSNKKLWKEQTLEEIHRVIKNKKS